MLNIGKEEKSPQIKFACRIYSNKIIDFKLLNLTFLCN